MKTFLKPTLLKIVLTFVLLIAVSWLWQFILGLKIMDTSYFGVPMNFFITWGPCKPGDICSEFNRLYLVLDIIFWYIAVAISIFGFQKK
jgi:hypothetical protein